MFNKINETPYFDFAGEPVLYVELDSPPGSKVKDRKVLVTKVKRREYWDVLLQLYCNGKRYSGKRVAWESPPQCAAQSFIEAFYMQIYMGEIE